MNTLPSLTVVHAPGSPEGMLDSALLHRNFTLTETYRAELLAAIGESDDPGRVLRMGLAIYANAINQGDTSACVEILLDALQGTRACVQRTVRGAAWAS